MQCKSCVGHPFEKWRAISRAAVVAMRDYRPAWGRLARAYKKRILLETKGSRLCDGGNVKAGHGNLYRDLLIFSGAP